MTRLFSRFFPLIAFISLFSCSGKEGKAGRITDPGDYYLDYLIHAEEGDDNLTVLLRFRDGEEGDAFLLPAGTMILLDNIPLEADSSKRAGGFYETQQPISSFGGRHSLVLKQGEQLLHQQSFEFYPMILDKEPEDSLSRQDLVLRLSGVQKEDYIRIIATDTAFYSDGINRLDTIRENQVYISRTDLESLVNGPVQLLLSREWEIPIEREGNTTGRLSVLYTLRREFILKD